MKSESKACFIVLAEWGVSNPLRRLKTVGLSLLELQDRHHSQHLFPIAHNKYPTLPPQPCIARADLAC